MRSVLGLWGIVAAVCAGYLAYWPVPAQPESWEAPHNPGYIDAFAPNDRLGQLEFLDLAGRKGPEDVAIGPDGLLYVATHDGEILRLAQSGGAAEVFAQTNGRPLGLEFGPNGTLYVADAYRGLLAITPDGAVRLLADHADGTPILYADDVDVAEDGTVYFTDASTRFGAEANGGTLRASVLDLLEHSDNGRVLKYDPVTEQTTLFSDGLTFPNGLAVGPDGSVYVVETGTYSVWRYAPDGSQRELVIGRLPGFPDNINPAQDGSFWVGLVSPRNALMDKLSDRPGLRRAILRLPDSMKPAPERYGFVLRIAADGTVLETLQDPSGGYALTTGAVTAADGSVFVSSLTESRLGVLRP
ncbi:SMP-30/gluconolactonase/LRE family protein [Thalassobius vesicularis]|uniref:SMP-30/gluconolactonase/LRE family protein n=1 Tax=Thalassobius vesicularis TaxID=1294297 RepID=A0A4S3M8I5_9RHOB|nr:SMP-30/gluconolactonase/LRE family protein [Thalassobius vesicularis]THD73762.1 SMP-30/gluconolactonase/LRE family protein [Thalassobius vesicularis]